MIWIVVLLLLVIGAILTAIYLELHKLTFIQATILAKSRATPTSATVEVSDGWTIHRPERI